MEAGGNGGDCDPWGLLIVGVGGRAMTVIRLREDRIAKKVKVFF